MQDQTEDRFPTLESEKSFPAHAGWRLPGLFPGNGLAGLVPAIEEFRGIFIYLPVIRGFI